VSALVFAVTSVITGRTPAVPHGHH